MKFSSIALIGATLAAIIRGAIAAPGPLYARALGQVHPFEVDGDKLFKRCDQKVHGVAATSIRMAAKASAMATEEAKATVRYLLHNPKHGNIGLWRQHLQQQSKLNESQLETAKTHDVAAMSSSPHNPELAKRIPQDISDAESQTKNSYQIVGSAMATRGYDMVPKP